MRGHPLRLLTLLALVGPVAKTASAHGAADARLELVIEQPGPLDVGERRSVELRLTIVPDVGAPLLVTPSVEGPAVEVVRGRLFRSDAQSDGGVLHLRIPIAVRAEGTSVLRVDALAYVCDVRCRTLHASASAVLAVHDR